MAEFAIGSRVWPGLSKLAEEAGEVVQVIGKLIATGGSPEHWDGLGDLRTRLENEIADLTAACIFVAKANGLDEQRIKERGGVKLARFSRWHELGQGNVKP